MTQLPTAPQTDKFAGTNDSLTKVELSYEARKLFLGKYTDENNS